MINITTTRALHFIFLLVSAFIFAYSLDLIMLDDGLRHIVFSAYPNVMQSWGQVFPNSLFQEYDQWLSWHKIIEFFLYFVTYEKVHIVINSISLFVLMALLYELIKKEVKYDFASVTYAIVFCITFFTYFRYVGVRPDFLSGLFIMALILMKNRFLPIFVLTLLYGASYYLFFLYTGTMGLVYLVQKKWNSFFALFIASLIVLVGFLIHDYESYIQIIIYILTDQSLRMGLEVKEGVPLFGFFKHLNYFILLPIFLIGSSLLIYKKYSYFKENTLATFLLVSSILWVNQVRYFYLLLPLILVYLFSVIVNSNKKQILKTLRKYMILSKRFMNISKKTMIFYIVLLPYLVVMFAYQFSLESENEEIEKGLYFKDEKFNNKTILSNSMHTVMFSTLYYNPSIKLIPSCSIGWFEDKDPSMKDIYIRMMKPKGISEEELAMLIKYVNADLYIHYMRNDEQVLNFEKLRSLGIIAERIDRNKIFFKIEKRKL